MKEQMSKVYQDDLVNSLFSWKNREQFLFENHQLHRGSRKFDYTIYYFVNLLILVGLIVLFVYIYKEYANIQASFAGHDEL